MNVRCAQEDQLKPLKIFKESWIKRTSKINTFVRKSVFGIRIRRWQLSASTAQGGPGLMVVTGSQAGWTSEESPCFKHVTHTQPAASTNPHRTLNYSQRDGDGPSRGRRRGSVSPASPLEAISPSLMLIHSSVELGTANHASEQLFTWLLLPILIHLPLRYSWHKNTCAAPQFTPQK